MGIIVSATVVEQQMGRGASRMSYRAPASDPCPPSLTEIPNSRLSEKQRSESSVESLYLYSHAAVSPLGIVVHICQRHV